MMITLRGLYFMIYFAHISAKKGTGSSNSIKWSDGDIASRIEIRLVKRTWFPLTTNDKVTLLQKVSLDGKQVRDFLSNPPLYEYKSWPLMEADKVFSDPDYDPQKETIVIVHPSGQDGSGTFIRTTVAVLCLRNFHVHYNIFAVSMQGMDPLLLESINRLWLGRANKLDDLGRVIAGFLQSGMISKRLDTSQLHFIGWSISSQIVGYVARALPSQVSSIVALNPFDPGVWRSFSLKHVSRRDARTVHAFHTAPFYQSSSRRVATADFVFNNGHVQPGCLLGASDCSLARAVYYFWHFILYPHMFVAKQCSNYVYFKYCVCDREPSVNLKYPLDVSASGEYYIETSGAPPYGLGERGASCKDGGVFGSLFN